MTVRIAAATLQSVAPFSCSVSDAYHASQCTKTLFSTMIHVTLHAHEAHLQVGLARGVAHIDVQDEAQEEECHGQTPQSGLQFGRGAYELQAFISLAHMLT
jgi:hypothetical protein